MERLKSTSDVDCVFGKPFESHGKLYVPCAIVRYGFGGGEETKEGHAGIGGGVNSKPAGVLEISADGARFIHFEPSWRQIATVGLVVWLGLRLLGGLRQR